MATEVGPTNTKEVPKELDEIETPEEAVKTEKEEDDIEFNLLQTK